MHVEIGELHPCSGLMHPSSGIQCNAKMELIESRNARTKEIIDYFKRIGLPLSSSWPFTGQLSTVQIIP